MNYKNRPFQKAIFSSLILILIALISTIVSFILLLSTRTTDTSGEKVVYHYNSAYMTWNMISFIAFVVFLFLWVFLLIIRFIKESKSEAWKVDKVDFSDSFEEGSFLLKTKKSKIDYLSLFRLNLFLSKTRFIVFAFVIFLCAMGLVILSFQPFQALYFYTFLLLLILSALLCLLQIFVYPLLMMKKNENEEFTIYQDKIISNEGQEGERICYYSQFYYALETKDEILLLYPDIDKRVYAIEKKNLSEPLLTFFSQKMDQIKRNNKRHI